MSDKKVSRRGYVKYATAGVVIVAGAAAGGYYATRPRAPATTTPTPKPSPTTPKPTPTPTPTVTPTGRPGEALIFDVWPWGTEIIEQNVATFEEQFNENVNLEVIPSDYPSIMENKLSTEAPLDMMFNFIDTSNRWYKAGWQSDVEDNPLIGEIKNAMYPGWLDAYTADDGKMLGLNYGSQLFLIWRNAKIFMDAGLVDEEDEPRPTTWDGIIEDCVTLKKEGFSEYPILAPLNTDVWWMIPWTFWGMAHGFGDRLFDSNYMPVQSFDNTVARILTVLKDLWDKELLIPGSWTVTEGDLHNLFSAGEHAYLIGWDWGHFIYQPALEGMCDFQRIPDKKGITCDGVVIYSITKRERSPEKWKRVWDLLNFFGYKDKNGEYTAQKRYQQLTSLWSPYPELAEDPEVKQLYEDKFLFKNMPTERYEELNQMHSEFKIPMIWKTLWSPEWQLKLSYEVYDAVTGKKEIDDAVTELKESAIDLQEKYKG